MRPAAEVELVDDLERIAEGVARAELVHDLREDLADPYSRLSGLSVLSRKLLR
jgi:hypothetical protein